MALKCRLKDILDERGIKQKWLIEKTGISQSAMSRIVNGTSLPTLEAAYKIAQALDVHIEDIWKPDD